MRITRDGSGTPWEQALGYARAVRAGNLVLVSGTVAADLEGQAVGDDAYSQALEAFRLVERSLVRLGSRLDHVLRLRVYYVDPAVGEGFGRAFAETFGATRPGLTTVRVTGLNDPSFLLEIEADAVVADWQPDPQATKLPEWDEGVD